MDFAVQTEHKVKIKVNENENEKMDIYLDLAREGTVEHEGHSYTNWSWYR